MRGAAQLSVVPVWKMIKEVGNCLSWLGEVWDWKRKKIAADFVNIKIEAIKM